jgi:hypothetical protein
MTDTSTSVSPYLELSQRSEIAVRIQGHRPPPISSRNKGGCSGNFLESGGKSFALFDRPEDAAFAALAWNNHYALIAALDRALFFAAAANAELPEEDEFEAELAELRRISATAKGLSR